MGITFSEGHLSKAVIIRVLPGSDVMEAIVEACQKLGIKSGAIIYCIGSLQRASVMFVVPLDNKVGGGYGDPKVLTSPCELLCGQGTIGQEENGEIVVHLHGVVSDKEGNLHGGHLVRGGNPVLITCEVIIAKLQGIKIIRSHDPKTDYNIFLAKGEENG
jgi:predicted DNA-binding protein with PD1-like motif